MAEAYLGEIRTFAFNFAPAGWQQCNGQTLAISSYSALFALVGTYYGGNGTSTFQLPNLQSRVGIHQGTGAGLSTYVIGQASGAETVALLLNNMPQHNHLIASSASQGTSSTPGGNIPASAIYIAGLQKEPVLSYATSSDGSTLASNAVSISGGSVPHSNIQPYLCLNFCIAMQGIFPSRN